MSDDIHHKLGNHDARLVQLEKGHTDLWGKLERMDGKLDQLVERMATGTGGGRMLIMVGSGIVGIGVLVGVIASVLQAFHH